MEIDVDSKLINWMITHKFLNISVPHVNVRNVQTCRELLEDFIWDNRQHILGSKISNAPDNISCAVSFRHSKSRREPRKMARRWKNRKRRLEHKIVKIMCLLRVVPFRRRGLKGGFQGCVNLDAQKQGAFCLLKAKIRLLVKKFYAWGMISHLDLPS